MNAKKIHIWMPEVFRTTGGIQAYSAFLLKVIQNSNSDIKYDVFSKNDFEYSPKSLTMKNAQFHFSGKSPAQIRTATFASQILTYGFCERPNLIITGHLNFAIAAYWLKRFIGVPYWIITYGIEAWDVHQPILQKALHYADKIISISSYTRDRLIKEQNIEPSKISLLPCTFDANRFQITSKPKHLLAQYKLTSDQPIILTVARLDSSEKYKGYDKIIQAMTAIRRQVPKAHYILVGKGSDRPRLEKLINQLNLQDCVTLAGFVPDEQLCDYYNLCDVFAMPSKKEGFGIVFLEAMACGKPTLGGNQDGAIDALCHGQLGALVTPDNIEEITQSIIQILQGSYPNQFIYKPEAVREAVIDKYGFESFKQTFNGYLEGFFIPNN